jgi:hypothetical protein
MIVIITGIEILIFIAVPPKSFAAKLIGRVHETQLYVTE